MPYKSAINIMKQAAWKAGQIQLKYFRQEMEVTHKTGKHDVLTQVDLWSQEEILKTLRENLSSVFEYPQEVGFIGEEADLADINKYNFIIDPLDGTSNYSVGWDWFSVIIALTEGSEVVAGVVYYPAEDIYYWGIKDQGAYKEAPKNKYWTYEQKQNLQDSLQDSTHEVTRLEVPEMSLDQVLIMINPTVMRQASEELIEAAQSVRFLSGFGLQTSLVAEGLAGAKLSRGPKLWDIGAPLVICSEAGVKFVDYQGQDIQINWQDLGQSYPSIVANPSLLDKILELF
jgi:myo-inositol-1(or 4)-monophosphatase